MTKNTDLLLKVVSVGRNPERYLMSGVIEDCNIDKEFKLGLSGDAVYTFDMDMCCIEKHFYKGDCIIGEVAHVIAPHNFIHYKGETDEGENKDSMQ